MRTADQHHRPHRCKEADQEKVDLIRPSETIGTERAGKESRLALASSARIAHFFLCYKPAILVTITCRQCFRRAQIAMPPIGSRLRCKSCNGVQTFGTRSRRRREISGQVRFGARQRRQIRSQLRISTPRSITTSPICSRPGHAVTGCNGRCHLGAARCPLITILRARGIVLAGCHKIATTGDLSAPAAGSSVRVHMLTILKAHGIVAYIAGASISKAISWWTRRTVLAPKARPTVLLRREGAPPPPATAGKPVKPAKTLSPPRRGVSLRRTCPRQGRLR